MRLPSALRSRRGWATYLEAQRPAQPHLHQIEPTNHCPYTCVMCPRPGRMERALGFMEPEAYRAVIDEVAGYDEPVRSLEIELFHFGESLLHPELPAMVRYASERGLNATLSVNAPHLTPTRADALLAAEPYRLIVSLDGYDDESYRRVRGPVADYAKAAQNLEHLAARLADAPPERTEVVVRIIELHELRDHIAGAREQWEALGLAVEVRPFFPWTEPELAELGDIPRNPPWMPCAFPWKHLVVQWDGTVVPCCRDCNGELALGNVHQQTLEEIWNGAAYARLREQHATGDYSGNPLCERCMSLYYHEGEGQ